MGIDSYFVGTIEDDEKKKKNSFLAAESWKNLNVNYLIFLVTVEVADYLKNMRTWKTPGYQILHS